MNGFGQVWIAAATRMYRAIVAANASSAIPDMAATADLLEAEAIEEMRGAKREDSRPGRRRS